MSDPSTPTPQHPPIQTLSHHPDHAESHGADHAPHAPAADAESQHHLPPPHQPHPRQTRGHHSQAPPAQEPQDAQQPHDGHESDEARREPQDHLHPNPLPNQSHQTPSAQPHPPQTLLAANAPVRGVHLLIGKVIDDEDAGWFRQNRNYVKAYQKLGRTVIGETAVCTIGPLQIN